MSRSSCGPATACCNRRRSATGSSRAQPGLEVVEIGCPAEHETRAEHTITLPTQTLEPGREWSGQQFVRHVAADAAWAPWRAGGFEHRDTGIAAATSGLAGAVVVRRDPG